MFQTNDNLKLSLKLTTLFVVAVLASGCMSAKSKPVVESEPATPPEPVVEPEPVPEPVVEEEPEPEPLTSWTVNEGDNLWGIAAEEEVYNVPEQWPLIYKANHDQIRDADVIFPGQILDIPRNSSQGAIDAAIEHAKNRGAWAVGPIEESDQIYLQTP